MDPFEIIYEVADILGTIAFASSGAMQAIEQGLDLFGVLFLGGITAVGGGVLRDALLGIAPPSAFRNPLYLTMALITSLSVFILAGTRERFYRARKEHILHYINVMDAIGLGIFSAIGVQTSIRCGYLNNGFLCVFMGMTTGVGGGILRDLLIRTVPAVLKKHIYAVASILGATATWGILSYGGNSMAAIPVGMFITFSVRMLSVRYKWNLPRIVFKEEGDQQ